MGAWGVALRDGAALHEMVVQMQAVAGGVGTSMSAMSGVAKGQH